MLTLEKLRLVQQYISKGANEKFVYLSNWKPYCPVGKIAQLQLDYEKYHLLVEVC